MNKLPEDIRFQSLFEVNDLDFPPDSVMEGLNEAFGKKALGPRYDSWNQKVI